MEDSPTRVALHLRACARSRAREVAAACFRRTDLTGEPIVAQYLAHDDELVLLKEEEACMSTTLHSAPPSRRRQGPPNRIDCVAHAARLYFRPIFSLGKILFFPFSFLSFFLSSPALYGSD